MGAKGANGKALSRRREGPPEKTALDGSGRPGQARSPPPRGSRAQAASARAGRVLSSSLRGGPSPRRLASVRAAPAGPMSPILVLCRSACAACFDERGAETPCRSAILRRALPSPPTRSSPRGERVFRALGCDAGEASPDRAGPRRANLYGHDSHGIGLVPSTSTTSAPATPCPVASRASSATPARSSRSTAWASPVGRRAAMTIAIGRARARLRGRRPRYEHAPPRPHRPVGRAIRGSRARVRALRQRALPSASSRRGAGPDARVSTNPFCVAVPSTPHPLVLDYATSAVALARRASRSTRGARWRTGCSSMRRRRDDRSGGDVAGAVRRDPAVRRAQGLGAVDDVRDRRRRAVTAARRRTAPPRTRCSTT